MGASWPWHCGTDLILPLGVQEHRVGQGPALPRRPVREIRRSHAGGLQGVHMNRWHSGYFSLRSAVMSDHEPTSPRETLPSDPEWDKPSEPTAIAGLGGATSASPLPSASSSHWPVSATMFEQGIRPRTRGHLSKMRRRLIVAAAAMGSVTGLFVGLGAWASAGATQPVTGSSSAGYLGSGGQGSNERSGPAAGGSSGHGWERGQVELHPDDLSGPGGNGRRGVFDEVRKGDELDLEERHCQGRTRPRTGDCQLNDHQGHSGLRANEWRRI